MGGRPAILAAKVEKLAAIMADGNGLKDSGNVTVSESRKRQEQAAQDVMNAGGSVAAVESVALPSERS